MSTKQNGNQNEFELKNVNDFKFFAGVLGDKLRNQNFKHNERKAFIIKLLEQISPYCSHKSYERIQKTLKQIGHQKDQDEQAEKAQKQATNNKKKKQLVSVKQSGKVDQHGVEIDDIDSEQQNDYYDDVDDDQYAKYQR